MSLGPVHLVLDRAAVDLDLHKVALLLAKVQLVHLSCEINIDIQKTWVWARTRTTWQYFTMR